MADVTEGSMAPDFDLATDGGGRIRLSALKDKAVVVYFYPKDDTQGCTLEAIDFTAELPRFSEAGAVVVGVSPDTADSHDKFKKKHDLSVVLAADPERLAIERYGVWQEKSMYGRKYMGVDRSTFLVAPGGKVARVWRGVKVKDHVREVLDAVRALS